MNPLLTTKQETFRAGTDNLEFFRERLLKMNNGALMFCTRGEANYHNRFKKISYCTQYAHYAASKFHYFTDKCE